MKDQQIVDRKIRSQQIKLGKRKSNSTSDLQISKKEKHGMDVIKERRRLREPQTKGLAEQDKKQLDDIQQKTQKIKSAVKKGTIIQTESDMDNNNKKHSTKIKRKVQRSMDLHQVQSHLEQGKKLLFLHLH